MDGQDALDQIDAHRPDLVLLDLQMPGLDGMEVVRLISPDRMPLVAFVTAWDQHALDAFELNAVDYLLKPVEGARLRETLNRAQERLEHRDLREQAVEKVKLVADGFNTERLRWIPVRRRDETTLVPVDQVVSVIADGELLHLHTTDRKRLTITYRLKDLEARLEPAEWIRLGRGTLARVSLIERLVAMPGGTFLARMRTGQELSVSRLQSRIVRERLLRL